VADDTNTVEAYTTSQVAALLRLRVEDVRALVQDGLIEPEGAGDQMRFGFRHLILLRTAKGLLDAGASTQAMREALTRMAERLPYVPVAPPPGVNADDRQQASFAFDSPPEPKPTLVLDAERAFALGCQLEKLEPVRAIHAYRQAVLLNPVHADAHINLGRLLHASADVGGAERHYRAALEARPRDATAAFNLGTALEDLGRVADAIGAYGQAIALDPGCADAYFNLARLYDRAGRRAEAFRHLTAYKRLADGR
jgi:tetratricopeptide (TPR) repeat protein